jgi:hypothetical protein
MGLIYDICVHCFEGHDNTKMFMSWVMFLGDHGAVNGKRTKAMKEMEKSVREKKKRRICARKRDLNV